MKPIFTKTLAAALVAATASIASIAPAHAGGQLSFNFAPQDAEQEQVMKLGLGFYALAKGIEQGGITQNGMNNAAGLLQNGGGNLGVIHQEGDNHNGTVQQNNGGNTYGLFQFGEGTSAHVNQNGGETGLGFVFGW